MSLLTSFGNALQSSITAGDRRQARSMQEKNIQLAEEQAQRTRNFDSISEISAIANNLGISTRAGEELDIPKLTNLLQQQRDSGKFDPELERFVTLVGNKDLTVERNPGFSFTNLQKGPDGTLTMQGTYEGDGKTAYATSNRQSGEDAEVGFSEVGQVANLLSNQYNQVWMKPGNATIKREMQLKGDLIVGEREALQGKIRDAVGSLTNELEEAILKVGGEKGPEISTKLKLELAGKPYTEQLKILQQYGSELQVPVSEIVTPEVEEAAAAEEAKQTAAPSQSAPADNSAEIAALEARIAKVPPGRGGQKRKAALRKQVASLKSASPAPAEEAAPVDENPAIQSGVEKAKAATDEDIVEGKVQFTQEEFEALQERLKAKDIIALEDMIKASPTEQQMLRAMLSTIARDADQRKEYLNRMNNVMSTGSTDYNSKDYDAAVIAQRQADQAAFDGNTKRGTMETGRVNANRLTTEMFETFRGDQGTFIGQKVEKISSLFKDKKTGEAIDPSVSEYKKAAFGAGGSISSIWGKTKEQLRILKSGASAMQKKTAQQQLNMLQQALLAQISFGMQFVSAKGDLEWSFPTDSGASLSGNDSALTRIGRDGKGYMIRKPGSGTQDGDAFTEDQLANLFGDEELKKFFDEKLTEIEGQR